MKGIKGDTTVLAVLGALVLSAIVIVGCSGKIVDLLSFGDDDAEKINSHIKKINTLTKNGVPATFSQQLSLGDTELLLYYSAGQEPIKLRYTGPDEDKNGHILFQRPDNPLCDNQACVCYCFQGPFWRSVDEEPFLEPRRIYTETEEPIRGWMCTNMICEATEDSQVVFTNSRGLDTQFIQNAIDYSKENEYQAIPLQIPLLLQGDYKGEDIHFDDQKTKHIEYLMQNYKWEGGVAIGGYAYSPNRKTRKDKNLEVPLTRITIEQSDKEHVVGVCLQETCLYEKAINKAQVTYTPAQTAYMKAEQAFSNLKQHILHDFSICMEQAAVTSEKDECAYSLQLQLVRASTTDPSKDNYTIGIKKDSQGNTIFNFIAFEEGNPTILDNMTSGLLYPYTQAGFTGTATPLDEEVYFTTDADGNIYLSNAPSVPTSMFTTLNTIGIEEVIVFIHQN